MKSEKTIQTPLPIKSIVKDLQIDPTSIEETSQKDPQSFYLHLAKLKSQKSWQSESVSKLQQSISDLEKSEKQDYSDYYYLTARLIAANGESEVLKTMLKQSGLSDEDSAERIKNLEDSEDVQKMKAALADFDEKNQKSQSKILGKITEIFEKLNPQNPQPNQQKPTLELTAEQKSKLQNQQTKLLEQLKTHGIERTASAIAALGRNPKDYLRQDQEIQQTDSDLQEANKKLKTLELSLGVSQKDEEKSPSATESIKSRFAAVKEKLTSEIQSSSQKNIQQTPNKEETDNLKQTNLLLASLLSERSGDSKENSERVNEIISLCEDAAESAVKTGFSLSSSQPANEELKQTWVGLRLMEELTRKDEVLRGLGGQSNGILQDTVEKLKQDRLDSNKSDFTPSDSPYPQTITGNRRLQRSLSGQKGSFEDIAANRHFEDFQKIKNAVAEDKKSKEWSKENVLKFFSESLKDFTSSVASDSSNAVKHFRRHPISSILAAAGVAISFVPGASSAPPLRMPNEDPVSGSGLRATEGSSFTTDLASPIFNSMAIPTSDYVGLSSTTAGMAVASKDGTTSFFKPDGNTLLKIPTESNSQDFLTDLSKASIGDYGMVLSPGQKSVSCFGSYVSPTDSTKIKIFADGATSEITASSLPLDQSKGAITKITAFGANQKKYALVWQGDSIDDNNEPKIFEITSNQQSNSLKEVSNDKCQEFLNDSEGRKAFEAARWTKSITQGLATTWVLPAGDDVYILSASSSQFGKSGIVKVTQEEYQKKIKPFSPSLQKTLNSYPAFVNSTKITFGPSSAISQVINTIPVPKRFNEICQAITSSTSKIGQAITSSTSKIGQEITSSTSVKVSDPATSTIEVPKQTSPQNPENNGPTSSQVGETQQDTQKNEAVSSSIENPRQTSPQKQENNGPTSSNLVGETQQNPENNGPTSSDLVTETQKNPENNGPTSSNLVGETQQDTPKNEPTSSDLVGETQQDTPKNEQTSSNLETKTQQDTPKNNVVLSSEKPADTTVAATFSSGQDSYSATDKQTSSQVGQTQQDTPEKPDDTTVANTISDQRGSDQSSTPVPQTSKLAINCNTCLEQLGLTSTDDRDKISKFIAENSEKIAKECGVSVKEFEGCFDGQASSSFSESQGTSSETLEAFTTYISDGISSMTSSTSNPATTSKLPDVITTIATSLGLSPKSTSLILSVAKNATSSADARSTSTSKALPFLKSTPAPNQNDGQPPKTVPASSSANGKAQNQGSTTNSPTPTPAPNQNDGQPPETVPALDSLNKATSSAENNGVNKEAIGGSVAAVAATLAIIAAFIFNRRSRSQPAQQAQQQVEASDGGRTESMPLSERLGRGLNNTPTRPTRTRPITAFSVRNPGIRNERIADLDSPAAGGRNTGAVGEGLPAATETVDQVADTRRSADSDSPAAAGRNTGAVGEGSPAAEVRADKIKVENPISPGDQVLPAAAGAGDEGSPAAAGAGGGVSLAAQGGTPYRDGSIAVNHTTQFSSRKQKETGGDEGEIVAESISTEDDASSSGSFRSQARSFDEGPLAAEGAGGQVSPAAAERAGGGVEVAPISPGGGVSLAAGGEGETPRRNVDSNSPAEIKEAGGQVSLAAGGAGDQVLPNEKNVSQVQEESLISPAEGRALFNSTDGSRVKISPKQTGEFKRVMSDNSVMPGKPVASPNKTVDDRTSTELLDQIGKLEQHVMSAVNFTSENSVEVPPNDDQRSANSSPTIPVETISSIRLPGTLQPEGSPETPKKPGNSSTDKQSPASRRIFKETEETTNPADNARRPADPGPQNQEATRQPVESEAPGKSPRDPAGRTVSPNSEIGIGS